MWSALTSLLLECMGNQALGSRKHRGLVVPGESLTLCGAVREGFSREVTFDHGQVSREQEGGAELRHQRERANYFGEELQVAQVSRARPVRWGPRL